LYDVETLRILAVNEAALLSYGYSREEILAMTIADIRPPEDLPRLLDEVAKLDAGTRNHGRWLHRRKNGEIFDVQVVSQDAREPGRHVRLVIATDVTEQRRAERALRENEERLREGEERFRIAFQSTPDAISIGRLEDGMNVAVNGGYCRLSGYTEDEVVGHTSLQLDLWVDTEQRASLFRKLHAEGAVRDAEVRIRRKDRSEFDAMLSSEVFKSGGRAYFLTVTREITEHKRSDRQQAAIFRIAEAANREGSLQEMLREIHHIVGELMHAPNFYIALYDAAAQTLSFPYYEDEHGDIPAGPEELGNGLTAFVLRKGQPLVLSDRAQFVALAAANEVDQVGVPALSWVGAPLISKRRTVGVLAAQIYSGTARYGQAEKELLQYVSTQVAHSIERKQDQETLRASEQRFRALIENSSDGISLLAADGEILYRSPAMAPMLGLAANAPHGNLLALLHPEDVPQMQSTLVAVQRKPAVPVLAQARVRREDGSIAVLEAVVTGLLEDPAVRGIVLNVRDVSDRKQLEAKLMMADRMVSVGTLAAGVAHEINNPLAYVLANLGFLDDALKPVIARGGVDRDVVEALQEVQAGAERVRNIVRDLKTFSRADDFCDAPVDVHRVLDAAANMAHNEVRHRARLVKDYATRLPLMTGNESRLGQVFLNLIINAAHARR
jgi:PAS domain S-box-containing protein